MRLQINLRAMTFCTITKENEPAEHCFNTNSKSVIIESFEVNFFFSYFSFTPYLLITMLIFKQSCNQQLLNEDSQK